MNKSKRGRRVTLKQVAEHAGVSRATASLVARNSPLIAEKTRKKVQQAMEDLNYVYDRIAANLRTQTSSTIGLIITEISNPYFAEIADGVHQTLDQAGHVVFLGTTFESVAKQDLLLSTMMENRVGGLILSPVSSIDESMFVRLRELGIPLVLIGRKSFGVTCDYVGVDNVYGAKIAVEHLIENGHRSISFLGGPSDSVWEDRKQGYCQALHEAGIDVEEAFIVNTTATREGGFKGVKQVFDQTAPPTAFFCYNDVVAFGVMSGLREMGLTPGKDIAVVGFDNIPGSEESIPKLTTVSVFPKQLGKIAADLLHQRMNGLDSQPQSIILTPELIVRESSNGPCPPRRN
ncbi:LacI family DNA-binding transcriptional regulator [Halalkalibacterium ligniniphilum]|uniref:LacI family DNA-binding transcriptional regulator n=1 Tax=Halalkalibacterium ligniniphilum TaxID=1134413 RepID=UPI000347A5BA|nr:LacI family DNA-binding transcriptional regulator [Halalkalibacterium ligniniphilum]